MTDKDSYILFELAGTTYALHSDDVHHMEMIEHITPVPNAAPFVEGVVFSRGKVIPAVNLRVRFGFPPEPRSLRSRMIVVDLEDRCVGLMVDAAREFQHIPAASIQPPGDAIVAIGGNYLAGIAIVRDRPILLLNIKEVLNFATATVNTQ